MRRCFPWLCCLCWSLGLCQSGWAQLYLNELMADNTQTLTDGNGNFDDWIEIYNAGGSPVSLAGYYITDDPTNPLAFWQLPLSATAELTVPAGGYLLLWADNEPGEGPTHLNFKLSATGEALGLYQPTLTPVDIVYFGPQTPDVSFGRTTDGAAVFSAFSDPTPRSANGLGGGSVQTFLARITHRIEVGNDDAEEQLGTVNLHETEIELGHNSSGVQTVGLRFSQVALAPGQLITDAYLQFQAEGVDTLPATLTIGVEDTGHSPLFVASSYNLTQRKRSPDSIVWDASAWETYYASGKAQRSPDLKSLLTHIVNRADWAEGQAITFLISGSGTRSLSSFEADSIRAPRLVIETALTRPVSPVNGLLLNELMAHNASQLFDEYQQDEDWVELYNASASPIHLGGLFLTDDFTDLTRWAIAADTVVPPGGFVLLWLDDDPSQGGLHSNQIKLDQAGDQLALVQILNGDTTVLDSVTFGPQSTNIPWGRTVDGGGVWEALSPASPGASNNASLPRVHAPVFSLSPGLYSGSQVVKITTATPGATIYLTTDGSVPTSTSLLYTDSLLLNTTTMLRARAFKSGYQASAHRAASYFFGLTDSLPVVSIITDPDSFFGASLGIYIYDNGAIASRKDWEREVNLEYFDQQQTLAFSQLLDSKLFGRTAIFYAQKSLSFDAKPGERIEYPLFPTSSNQQFKSFLLRSSSDDWARTLFGDAFHHAMFDAAGLRPGIMRYQPTVLYINGAYYGINNLRDKYNEDYFQFYYGADPDRIDLIKKVPGSNSGVNEVLAGDDLHYNALKSFIQGQDLSIPANYAYVQTQMDVDDYIDYCIGQTYVGNTSWRHNRRFWRPRTPDGRWRWTFNDLDRGSQWGQRNQNIISQFLADDDFFGDLAANPDFVNEFVQRMNTWTNTLFHPDHYRAVVDSLEDLLEPEIQDHINRWSGQGGLSSLSNWHNYIGEFRNFADYRPAKIREQLGSNFTGIVNDTFRLSIPLAAQSGGRVHLHQSEIPLPWNYAGPYFKNVPMIVKAIPDKGYRFVMWLETGNTQATILLDTAVNTILTPIFTEKDPILTEIHYHPVAGAQYEFIELYNPSGYPLDLNGYYFDEGIRDTLTFVMAPQSYVVIAADSTLYSGQGFPVYQWGSGSLDNQGETIRLRYPNGQTAEKVRYNNNFPWPDQADGKGPSLALKDLSLDNDEGYHWKACCGAISPGQPNGIPQRAPGNVSAGLQLWLRADAGSLVFRNDSLWASTWIDQSGQARHLSQTEPRRQSQWFPDSLNQNGLIAMDGQDDFYRFPEVSDVRTAFVVHRRQDQASQSYVPILGHSSYYDFHGGANGLILSATYAANAVKSGDWRLNGAPLPDPTTTLHNGQFSLLSLLTTANARTDQLSQDRNFTDRNWDGEIAEVILYNTVLSTPQRNQVETYLNIKYGLPIPVSTHSLYPYTDYPHHLAGIGQDDSLQCLQQRNSQSQAPGALVRIRKPQDLQNGEYLLWGNNLGRVDTLPNDVNGLVNNAVERVWRIREIGEVGSVKLLVEQSALPAAVNVLYVSRSETFDAADTRPLALAANEAGQWEVWVDFADGDYFTFGRRELRGPVGITEGLKFWWRPEVLQDSTNGADVQRWADFSGWERDAFSLGGDAPSYVTDAAEQLNFHPVLRFEKERLLTESQNWGDSLSLFVVGKLLPGSDPWARYVNLDYLNAYLLARRGTNDDYAYLTSGLGATVGLDGIGDWDLIGNVIGGGTGRFYTEGQLRNSRSAFLADYDSPLALGGNHTGNLVGEKIDGWIAEVIAYDAALPDTQRQDIETYLSLKYGFPIPVSSHRYYGHAAYPEQLVGLGRDSSWYLNQNQSHSTETGSILTLSDPAHLDEGEFLVVGHDGAAVDKASASADVLFLFQHRMARVWRVSETGDLGKLTLRFDLNGLGWNPDPRTWVLTRASGPTFETSVIGFSETSRLENGVLVFDNVSLSEGEYFTLSQLRFVELEMKAFLSGAYSSAEGLMGDQLRSAGLLPLVQPYTPANGWNHTDLETISPERLAQSGPTAIVDWVLVELRSATDSALVLHSRAVLLQRDGALVDTKGEKALIFRGVSPGSFFVSLRHRNHLGVMTQSAQALSESAIRIDFTDAATPVYGHLPQKEMSPGVWGLWAGDANHDGKIAFSGIGNDPIQIFLRVLSDPGNVGFLRNYLVPAYDGADTNLDGLIIYQGAGQDTNPIFLNVLSHPDNIPAFNRNFFLLEQLP